MPYMIHDIDSKLIRSGSAIVANQPELKPNDASKDISLDPIVTLDLIIKTTIHHTDTIRFQWGNVTPT